MLKKIILLCLLFIFGYSKSSYSAVEFKVDGSNWINGFVLDKGFAFAEHKSAEFAFVYDDSKKVVYIKHKNLKPTFKVTALELKKGSEFLSLRDLNSRSVIANYQTQTYLFKTRIKDCFSIKGSKDLYKSLGSGVADVFMLYKAFVYMTGQLDMHGYCKNSFLGNSYDKLVGVPLAVFYQGKQLRVSEIKNLKDSTEKILVKYKFDVDSASYITPELQYELLFSLLEKQQQKVFLKRFDDKKIDIFMKIKALNGLLTN